MGRPLVEKCALSEKVRTLLSVLVEMFILFSSKYLPSLNLLDQLPSDLSVLTTPSLQPQVSVFYLPYYQCPPPPPSLKIMGGNSVDTKILIIIYFRSYGFGLSTQDSRPIHNVERIP